MEKFFFFFFLQSPLPLSVPRSSCTHVNDRGERGKKRKGAGGRKRERREERRDLKRYAEYRLWWMPQPVATMFSLHWSALLRNIPSPPPRIPLLADFPTPRQTAIEPLYTLVCASEEYILQTGGGARGGECNIDNNYGTGSVCRITNRRQDFGEHRNRTHWQKRFFLFLIGLLIENFSSSLNSDTRNDRPFAAIDSELRFKLHVSLHHFLKRVFFAIITLVLIYRKNYLHPILSRFILIKDSRILAKTK